MWANRIFLPNGGFLTARDIFVVPRGSSVLSNSGKEWLTHLRENSDFLKPTTITKMDISEFRQVDFQWLVSEYALGSLDKHPGLVFCEAEGAFNYRGLTRGKAVAISGISRKLIKKGITYLYDKHGNAVDCQSEYLANKPFSIKPDDVGEQFINSIPIKIPSKFVDSEKLTEIKGHLKGTLRDFHFDSNTIDQIAARVLDPARMKAYIEVQESITEPVRLVITEAINIL